MMPLLTAYTRRTFLLAIFFCLAAHISLVRGQQPTQNEPSKQEDDVLRIKTELVQTDLMVFDKQGRFVEGLRPEQFELTLDGKSHPISFFERVTAGSANEAAQVTAARGVSPKPGEQDKRIIAGATDRGRIVFFFLDDLHLSESSITRARKALLNFVENQMSENDQVAIVSTSGQIGFLQQLTDNKAVLAEAITRLKYRRTTEIQGGKVPISENDANQVQNGGDRDLFMYLVQSTQNEYYAKGVGAGRTSVNLVRNRVRQINIQSKTDAANTLDALEGLMLSSSALPGRKLVIFMSDGFLVDPRRSNAADVLRRVTDEAARAGVVVYTMDVRGTFSNAAVDATRNDYPDLSSPRVARNIFQEATATQEPLRILADDTGGRAILNSNSIPDALLQSLKETNDYYLLAWRPNDETERDGKSRIKVTIKNRPDLRVRLRRNYYVAPPTPSRKNEDEKRQSAPSSVGTPEAGLVTALGSVYPQRTLPTALSVGYLNTPDQGLVLKASMQLERASLGLAESETQKSEVDVLGAAIDDRGIIVTFKQVLTIPPDPQNQQQAIVWHQQLRLQPGLYQVRVAVRERASGRTGSAQQWIEVPDLSPTRFQLSSLFLGERKVAAADEKFATAPRPVLVDVDHHFKRSSALRFQTYVYNATRDAAAPPDVEIQARVLRDNRAVVTVAPIRLPTDTTKDLARLPYWSEIALDQLPPGRYTLQITATDHKTKKRVAQQAHFVVD